MVTRAELTHLIHCDVDVFWRDFIDDAFNHQVFVSGMGYPSYRVLEKRVDGPRVWRRVEFIPKVHLPDTVTKIVGTRLSFIEEGEYDGQVYRYSFLPPAGFKAGLAVSQGEIRAERTPDGNTRRSVSMSCEVRMFGLGAMLESAAIKTARDAYDAHAHAVNELLAKRG